MNIITHNTKPVFFEDFINNFFGSNIYNDIPPYNICLLYTSDAADE